VLVEIVILAAGRTFGGAADMTFLLELVLADLSETGGTPTHGGAYSGMFGVGFFSVYGGVTEVIGKTLFSQEDAMTGGARMSGGGIGFVGAVGLETSVTFLAFARVMSVIVLIEGGFAAEAKVIASQKAWQGIAAVVVFSDFDEDDLFVLRRSFEDDLVVVIQGKDDELVVGEMTLKLHEFGDAARAFGNACITMKGLSFSSLHGSGLSQTPVVGVTTSQIAIGFHGDDGACATESILVLDLDHALFEI